MSQLLFCKGFSSCPPQWVKGALSFIKHSIFFTFPIYQIFWKIDCHVLTSNQHNRKYWKFKALQLLTFLWGFWNLWILFTFYWAKQGVLSSYKRCHHEQNKIHILLKWLNVFVFEEKYLCLKFTVLLLCHYWPLSGHLQAQGNYPNYPSPSLMTSQLCLQTWRQLENFFTGGRWGEKKTFVKKMSAIWELN